MELTPKMAEMVEGRGVFFGGCGLRYLRIALGYLGGLRTVSQHVVQISFAHQSNPCIMILSNQLTQFGVE